MAYDTLKGLIRQYIKTNGQNEITGQILQNVLIAMVDEYPSLTGYATQQWVESQGYLTDADLSNFATQTWVEAQLLGYLPTSTAIINNVVQSADGSVKLSGSNFADTYLDFTHTHRFEELTDLPTALQDYGITDAYISSGVVYLGGASVGSSTNPISNATSATSAGSASYADEAREADTLDGHHASDFLTSGALEGYATQSWVNTQLYGYLPLSAGSGNPLTGDLYMDDNYVRFDSGTQAIGYSSRINSSQFYVEKTTAATIGTDSVSVEGGKITVYSEYNDFDEGMVSSELVITATGIKVNNQPLATQAWVQSQGYITSAALTGYATQTWVGQYFVPISVTYINEVTLSADGSLKLSGSNFVDTYLDFTHTHRFEELTDLPTLLQDFGITGGTLSDLTVNNATVNNTLIITNGNDYVSIAGEGITIVDENAGTFNINMSSAGYMAVDTSIVASSFIKNGGTSSQFLKADGSVDSNAYITSAALTGYATQSWVNTQLTGYLPLSAGSGKPLTGDLYMSVNNIPFSISQTSDRYELSANKIWIDTSSLNYKFGSLFEIADVYDNYVRIDSESFTIGYWDSDDGDVDQVVIQGSGITIGGNLVATQQWVQQQGYITSAALTGYATQTWVGQYFVPISVTYINEVTQSADGSLKLSGSNFVDTYLDFTHTHRFEELTDLPTLLQDFGITGGTLSDLTVNNATVNNTLIITNGNDYVSIAGEGITIVDENAGTFNINMSSAGYMAVDTSIVASSFIKNGGTSSQFLKADGSVDSNAYITSAALSGYATQSWVQQQGYLTSSALTGYATQTWVGQYFVPISVTYINEVTRSADGSMKFLGRNFADVYADFTHDHRWEEIKDRPNIEIGGYGMIYTDGKFGVGIKVPSYPIDVDGSVRAAGFVNSSDARLKDIEDYDADISVEAVSMAPAVHYQWKNRKDKTTMVGSIAQYWQNLLPEAVSKDDNGYLSMQYDVIALISAISIAKRTVEHERRIAELESENAQLRLELNSVKEAIL